MANLTATVSSAEVIYGQAAADFQNPDMLSLTGLSKTGGIVSLKRMWHPQLVKSYSLEDGIPIHGGDSHDPASSGKIAIPFSPNLWRVRVSTPGKPNVTEVNVRPAIVAFCEAHRSDPACATVQREPQTRTMLPMVVR